MVDRFVALSRDHLEASPSIAELCRKAGLRHWTLLRAFQAIHATTPHRYLLALRLDEVRRTLMSPQTQFETVTQVATRFGFHELGRFASQYRLRFDESPSQNA